MEKKLANEHSEFNQTFRDKSIALEQIIIKNVEKLVDQIATVIEPQYTEFVANRLCRLAAAVHEADEDIETNYIYMHVIFEHAATMCEEMNIILRRNIEEIKMLNKKKGKELDLARAYMKKRLAIFSNKIYEMTQLVKFGRNLAVDDLYCQPPTSRDWQLLRSITTDHSFGDPDIVINNYITFASKIFFMLAAISKGAGLIPMKEVEVNAFLDKAFVDPQPLFPIKFGDGPEATEEQLDAVSATLIARFIKYSRNPGLGMDDGAFFVANPDLRIIRLLFNFPEKAWIRVIRKAWQYPSVNTDLKHYIDTDMFAEFFEAAKHDSPRMMKPNMTKIVLNMQHLVQDAICKKREVGAVRVRLIYHGKLKDMHIKLAKKPKSPSKQCAQPWIEFEDEIEEVPDEPSFRDRVKISIAHDFDKVNHIEQPIKDHFKRKLQIHEGDEPVEEFSKNMFKKINPSDITDIDTPINKDTSNLMTPKLNDTRNIFSAIMKVSKKANLIKFDVDYDPKTMGQWLNKEEAEDFKRVIVHIHGGGFVAQSSSSHQLYLNKWANDFEIPIFSIDYRLAPAAQFPEPLNDVISSYLWLLNYLEFIMQVRPVQIIGIGDSAGGNLLTGLTSWCIMNRVRAPDSLLMFYPAMSLEADRFTPSMLFSMNDLMLNYSALKMCGLYYVGEGQEPNKNPFLSPCLLSDDILCAFPPIHMYVSERDPLRDDCMRFALKAHKAGAFIRINYLKSLSHGLLNASHKKGIPEGMIFMEMVNATITKIIKDFVPMADN